MNNPSCPACGHPCSSLYICTVNPLCICALPRDNLSRPSRLKHRDPDPSVNILLWGPLYSTCLAHFRRTDTELSKSPAVPKFRTDSDSPAAPQPAHRLRPAQRQTSSCCSPRDTNHRPRSHISPPAKTSSYSARFDIPLVARSRHLW